MDSDLSRVQEALQGSEGKKTVIVVVVTVDVVVVVIVLKWCHLVFLCTIRLGIRQLDPLIVVGIV